AQAPRPQRSPASRRRPGPRLPVPAAAGLAGPAAARGPRAPRAEPARTLAAMEHRAWRLGAAGPLERARLPEPCPPARGDFRRAWRIRHAVGPQFYLVIWYNRSQSG